MFLERKKRASSKPSNVVFKINDDGLQKQTPDFIHCNRTSCVGTSNLQDGSSVTEETPFATLEKNG